MKEEQKLSKERKNKEKKRQEIEKRYYIMCKR